MISRGGKGSGFLMIAALAFFGYVGVRGLISPSETATYIAFMTLGPLVFVTIFVHQKLWITLDPCLIPFDPNGPASPEILRSHFADTAEELGRLGFWPRGYFLMKQAVHNANGSVLLFMNEATRETARILTAVSTTSRGRVATSLVVFSSEFPDGTLVATSNRTSANFFPPSKPPLHGRAFPQVRNVARLLQVHRARVENLAAGQSPVDEVADDPEGYLRRVNFEAGLAHNVDCGYAYNDEMAGVQRITWKGAILGSWKLLPPFKQILLAWERLMAARQLSNLEAGRPVS